MTLEEIKASNKLFLLAEDVAPVIGANPNTIRIQAHNDPALLGFPVCVMGKMVRIPRLRFLEFLGVAT